MLLQYILRCTLNFSFFVTYKFAKSTQQSYFKMQGTNQSQLSLDALLQVHHQVHFQVQYYLHHQELLACIPLITLLVASFKSFHTLTVCTRKCIKCIFLKFISYIIMYNPQCTPVVTSPFLGILSVACLSTLSFSDAYMCLQ